MATMIPQGDTYIDLRYLNERPKKAGRSAPARAVIQRAYDYAYDASTLLGFRLVGSKFMTVRHIPIAFI